MSRPALSQKENRPKCTWPWWLVTNLFLLAGVLWLGWQKTQKISEPFQHIRSVVATVNGQHIYARDLLSAGQFSRTKDDSAQLQVALAQLIREEVVAAEARQRAVPREKIEKRLQDTTHQFAGTEKWEAALALAGLTRETLEQRLQRHAQVESWLLIQGRVEPDEATCRAWYEANPDIAALPEAVEASHFAAIFPPRGTPEEILGKSDLIRDAQERLKTGIPWPQLIEALSDDPAKKVTGGSLNWFREERMERPLATAAFALPLNTISPPVETRFGFHLLEVTDHQAASKLPYEAVASEVQRRCADELTRKKIQGIIADLVQRAKIVILDSHFQKPLL